MPRVHDPPAAEHLVAARYDDALPRRDGALRRPELDVEAERSRRDDRGHILTAVPDPHLGLERTLGRRTVRDPAHPVGHETPLREQLVRADHDTVLRRIDLEHVHRSADRDAEPATLPDR